MKKQAFLVIRLALLLSLLFLVPSLGAEEPGPQRAPSPPPLPYTGFIMPQVDLSHLTGQRMPEKFAAQELPPVWDWREYGKVTPIKDQGACGSCYAFASIANIESKMLIDNAGNYNFSENNAKECNWKELNNYVDPSSSKPVGSCDGGNYIMLAGTIFSQKGVVNESCDPYVAQDVACKTTCPYIKTLLDWRMISGRSVPNTDVLKAYIYNYGPVFASMYVDSLHGFNASYDGSYTFNYTVPSSYGVNHSVLIVGWSNQLPPVPGGTGPADGWIVKNSWGVNWGDNGYFYITYGSANIGWHASFIYDWQDYDPNGELLYYDDDGWTNSWRPGGVGPATTAWGLCKFIPTKDAYITRVEFWTTDRTTDVDVYVYDDFNGAAPSNLLSSVLDLSFDEAGYHSVALPAPVPVTAGDDVIAVVKFTNAEYTYPIAADKNGPSETGRTYISRSGSPGSWLDLGAFQKNDVGIRLRLSTTLTWRKIYMPCIMKKLSRSRGGKASHLSRHLAERQLSYRLLMR